MDKLTCTKTSVSNPLFCHKCERLIRKGDTVVRTDAGDIYCGECFE
jgi:hypothetical protein